MPRPDPDPDRLRTRFGQLRQEVGRISTPPPVARLRRRRSAGPVAVGALVAALLVGTASVLAVAPPDRSDEAVRTVPADSEAMSASSVSRSAAPTTRPAEAPSVPAPTTAAPRPVAPRSSVPRSSAVPQRVPGLLVDGTFESGGLAPLVPVDGNDDQVEVVAGAARAGRRAASVEITKDSPGWSSELRAGGAGGPHRDRERWIGFSTYLPPDWDTRYESGGEVSLFDVDQPRDGCDDYRPSAVTLVMWGGRLRWVVRWNDEPCTRGGDVLGGATQLVELTPVRGRWVDWVVHLRWSYGTDGMVELWQDGKKLADYRGPVGHNDQGEAYVEVGIVHHSGDADTWPAGLTRRVALFDDVRVAGAGAGYASVAPG